MAAYALALHKNRERFWKGKNLKTNYFVSPPGVTTTIMTITTGAAIKESTQTTQYKNIYYIILLWYIARSVPMSHILRAFPSSPTPLPSHLMYRSARAFKLTQLNNHTYNNHNYTFLLFRCVHLSVCISPCAIHSRHMYTRSAPKEIHTDGCRVSCKIHTHTHAARIVFLRFRVCVRASRFARIKVKDVTVL